MTKHQFDRAFSDSAQHRLHPNTRLGQHFLKDKEDYDRIAGLVPRIKEQFLLEVGPGPGDLTRALLRLDPKLLHAIEKDHRFIPGLQALAVHYPPGRLTIKQGDILKEDEVWSALVPPQKWNVVANLPYYISNSFLLTLCARVDLLEHATIMLQKDLADRLLAMPSTRAYGRISVMLQMHFKLESLGIFRADQFDPKPKVDSSLIGMRPLGSRPESFRNKLAELTHYAFHQRRKTLRNSLKNHPDGPLAYFPGLNLDPGVRAECLSVEDFARLVTAMLQDRRSKNSD